MNIRSIVTDGGGEYISDQFKPYLKYQEISHEQTVRRSYFPTELSCGMYEPDPSKLIPIHARLEAYVYDIMGRRLSYGLLYTQQSHLSLEQ